MVLPSCQGYMHVSILPTLEKIDPKSSETMQTSISSLQVPDVFAQPYLIRYQWSFNLNVKFSRWATTHASVVALSSSRRCATSFSRSFSRSWSWRERRQNDRAVPPPTRCCTTSTNMVLPNVHHGIMGPMGVHFRQPGRPNRTPPSKLASFESPQSSWAFRSSARADAAEALSASGPSHLGTFGMNDPSKPGLFQMFETWFSGRSATVCYHLLNSPFLVNCRLQCSKRNPASLAALSSSKCCATAFSCSWQLGGWWSNLLLLVVSFIVQYGQEPLVVSPCFVKSAISGDVSS